MRSTPDFDGHPERTLLHLTPDERIAWIWQGMQLLRAGMRARGELHLPPPSSRDPET